ncbi:MAG: phosphatase PAP2 family protein [Phormidesmis sp.]
MGSKPKTVVPHGIKAIAQRFWQDSRNTPSAAWTLWWKTLAIGLGICALIVYVMTRLAMGWESTWMQAWDEKWLLAFQDYNPLSFAKGVTWESPGNLVGMLPVFLTLTALTAWFRKPLIAATVVVTYLGQFALVWISWGMWSRDRPNLIADGLAAPSLHSFPSGHVVVSITVYGLIFYLWFRTSRSAIERLIAIAFAILWIGLISLARLALGAHWPSDVIASLLVGALWLIVVIVALERAFKVVSKARFK